MKIAIFLSIIALSNSLCFSQNNAQLSILKSYISIHNSGEKEEILQFIQDTYHPDPYKKDDIDKHVEF